LGSNAPNVRLGVEKKQDFSSAPWSDSSKLQTEQRAYADYTYFVNNQLSFGVNVDHVKRFEDADESSSTSTTAKLNYRIGKFVIAAQYQHGVRSEFEQDNQRFYVNVSWNQYRASNNSLTRLSYLGQSETWQANYNKLSTNMAHDIGYDVLLRQDADENYVSVRSDYQHNWLAAEAEFSRNDAYRNSSESRVSLSSSIAIADGVVGIGRNIRTPYAIVKKHQTLHDSQVLINPDSRGKYVGYATDNVAGLVNLGTPYTQSGVVVDVKNAPLGYDIGAGTYELVGANQSAHSILIGSDEAYTVIGYLVDNKEKPIALARGVMTLGNKSWPFFTNKRGRFVVEGVSIGSALLQMGELKTVVELTQQNGNLIILNNLIMEAK
jgi:outer membrane usher protein